MAGALDELMNAGLRSGCRIGAAGATPRTQSHTRCRGGCVLLLWLWLSSLLVLIGTEVDGASANVQFPSAGEPSDQFSNLIRKISNAASVNCNGAMPSTQSCAICSNAAIRKPATARTAMGR